MRDRLRKRTPETVIIGGIYARANCFHVERYRVSLQRPLSVYDRPIIEINNDRTVVELRTNHDLRGGFSGMAASIIVATFCKPFVDYPVQVSWKTTREISIRKSTTARVF